MSLRRQLVLGVSALVAAAFVLTGTTTVLALRASVLQQLDQEVLTGLDLAATPGEGAGGGATPPPADGSAEPAPRIGTLTVVIDSDGTAVRADAIDDDGSRSTLTDAQLEAVTGADPPPRTPVTVDLGGELGTYRIAEETIRDSGGPDSNDSPRTVISGNSMHGVTSTTTALTAILAGVLGSAFLLVIGALAVIVTRSLRPLRRVAGVARRVSEQPLASGEVVLPDRVAPADTDPRTEAGQVGSALNSLLENIVTALNQRQASEDRLRRFVADASHELRTPLTSIRGYAELSRAENAPMTPTQQRSLERITAESNRMSSLVEDLLLLARLDAGQPLRTEVVDLAPLVIDAVSDAHAAAPDHHWLVDVGEPIDVTGDEDRLLQVVTNILGNAAAHTPPGTTVEAGVRQQAGHALLRIVDDGPGIPDSLQERLFDRFARDDSSRARGDGGASGGGTSSGGAGLGLAISHAIVTAHGGWIEVDSAAGRTEFTVHLPMHPAT